jgi:deoxyribodipyrimidine photolyase-related protein
MSNYCASCRYDVTARTGPRACPFNYLYWNFFITHRSRLKGNMRLAMIYKTVENMTPDKQAQIRADSQKFLDEIQSHVGAWS